MINVLNQFNRSYIVRSELARQQHKPRHRWTRLLYADLAAAGGIFFALAFYSLATNQPMIFSPYNPLVRLFGQILLFAVLIFHFGVMLKTLHLTSSAVARDKRNAERWETLILTGISARELVRGKWWAVIRIMWREYMLLALVRPTAVICLYSPSIFFYPWPYSLLRTVSVFIFITILTLINLPYTAACGVMSSMERKRGGYVPGAFAARTAFTVFAGIIPLLATVLYEFSGLPPTPGVIRHIYDIVELYATTMIDNGATLAAGNFYPFDLLVLVLVSGVLLGLTWALLRFAEWTAARYGALYTHDFR